MQILHTIDALRLALADRPRPVFVPTMGNLHAGHLALVAQARAAAAGAAPVVTSIFVNRLQFAPHEDFDSYPRTFERDCALLQSAGNDIVFAPSEAVLYPEPQDLKVVPPAALADILEGAHRPGFFTGVCTVVLKLFHIVQPAAAVFGEKDWQQLTIVRHMLRQLALPVQLLAGPTCRAGDGLALSSRNGYLTADQRAEAPALADALRALADALRADALRAGRLPEAAALAALETRALDGLRQRGWQPDYVALRRQSDLGPPQPGAALVLLAAARLGATRLIDNLLIDALPD